MDAASVGIGRGRTIRMDTRKAVRARGLVVHVTDWIAQFPKIMEPAPERSWRNRMGNESWLVCKLRARIAELERDLQQERNASNRSVALLVDGEALREKTMMRAI